MNYTATYSPDDNKLRLYAGGRLPADVYARVKAAGFKWAPKQELFVAPMWTPDREELLIELAGEIGDEDTSLTERAEERADRFEEYSDNRERDAESARKAVAAIADNIPLGQPILVGHHSEKHARRDAEKIENGMRRAVKMWDTSKYWQDRARGAIRHAKYKERPDVRARRIKGIEADKRKQERHRSEAERYLKLWTQDGLTLEQARAIANVCWLTVHRDGAHHWTAYDVLRPDGERYASCPAWTVEQVQEVARRVYPPYLATCDRWIAHYNNRLEYERAMLADAGGTVADRVAPEKGGAVRCWSSPGYGKGWSYIQKVNRVSVTVLDNWGNGGRDFTRTIPLDNLAGIMTAAQVREAREAGRLAEVGAIGFYLREPGDTTSRAETRDEAKDRAHREAVQAAEARDAFEGMRETLRAGVQVVSAPQLFPTPPDLASRMVELAEIPAGARVLEPSAGTGNILRALPGVLPFGDRRQTWCEVVAVEINAGLAERLKPWANVVCSDFLKLNGELGTFDRVLMNPPFENAVDIKHITHAVTMLRPGGRLVAICANGPRQRDALQPIATSWEDLPPGTFLEAGTGVNTALLVVEKEGIADNRKRQPAK